MADKIYEISLWEDFYDSENEYYDERKLCVIGSDSMTDQCRAVEPKLVSNINGTHTFTFKMFYKYTKDFTGERYDNPFINLLVNERKVKVFWEDEWYDLIIKNCQEDSSGKSITYTCKDLFINELSKNGFNIELNTDLGNNQGSIEELATMVLTGSDWQLGECDKVVQLKEQSTYLTSTIYEISSATNQKTGEPETIPENRKILFFYDQIQDIIDTKPETAALQFAYTPDDFETDLNSQLVINTDCYETRFRFNFDSYETNAKIVLSKTYNRVVYEICTIDTSSLSEYRAERMIDSQRSIFDPLTKKYVNIYEATEAKEDLIDNGDIIYEYEYTDTDSATVIANLLANSEGFTNLDCWEGENLALAAYPEVLTEVTEEIQVQDGVTEYNLRYYPFSKKDTSVKIGETNLEFNIIGSINNPQIQLINSLSSGTLQVTYKVYEFETNNYLKILNEVKNNGIVSSLPYLKNGFAIGDKLVFTYEAITSDGDGKPSTQRPVPVGRIVPSIVDSDGQDYFSVKQEGSEYEGYYILTCTKPLSKLDIRVKKIKIKLQSTIPRNSYWLKRAELYQYKLDSEGEIIKPGNFDEPVLTVKHFYYNHTKSSGLIDAEDIIPLYDGTGEPDFGITPILNDFEKIRSIEAKESNRFNIIQSLAEAFECWPVFRIEHDNETGKCLRNEDGSFKKYVDFKLEVGKQTGIGFVYGIDLNTIKRTIQSDNITTKTIVPANSNQFGTNGFCTIARSQENYPRATYILNFDYYINKGLLPAEKIIADKEKLETVLHNNNIIIQNKQEGLNVYKSELNRQESQLKTYEGLITAAEEQINNLRAELLLNANLTDYFGKDMRIYISQHIDDEFVYTRRAEIIKCKTLKKTYEELKNSLDVSIPKIKQAISDIESEIASAQEDIDEAEKEFNSLYINYIQEGTWKSDEYMDDTLYYLDAQSVAYTSSRPQVTYDIAVYRLSRLQEFSMKKFYVGDIAYVEDTDFFGYLIDGITPYKESVLITEVTSNFDEPEKDSFKVQNYRTQFEDLFQRVVASSQSLQFAQGNYARAASLVNLNGTIDFDALQQTLMQNNGLGYYGIFENIIIDSTGIQVTDPQSGNNRTKITAGGVFISTDGGLTWGSAITSGGIVTQYLTAGVIETTKIQIMDGNFPTFRWDALGISAFDFNNEIIIEVPIPQNQGDNIQVDLLDYMVGSIKEVYYLENGTKHNLSYSYETSFENDRYAYVIINLDSQNIEKVYIACVENINQKKYVRYDRFGVYGININDNNITTFNPSTEDEIWDSKYAKFGLTWRGFFLNGDEQAIRISNEDDITIYKNDQKRVKIGRFNEKGETYYGLALYNEDDEKTLYMNDTGQLMLAKSMQIVAKDDVNIFIGDGDNGQVFNANDHFIIDDQGNVTVSGTVSALAGDIGGFSIGESALTSHKILDFGNTKEFSITLNGEEGEIRSFSTYVEDVLTLGHDETTSTFLYNPDRHPDPMANEAGLVLVAGRTKINNAGVITLGAIDTMGAEGKIVMDAQRCMIYGENFSISNGISYFEDVNINGTLRAAVFEKNKVNVVGGSMFFKGGYKIVKQETSWENSKAIVIVTIQEDLEEYPNTNKDGSYNNIYVYLTNKDGTLSGYGLITNKTELTATENRYTDITIEDFTINKINNSFSLTSTPIEASYKIEIEPKIQLSDPIDIKEQIGFQGSTEEQRIFLKNIPNSIENIHFTRLDGQESPSDGALEGISINSIDSDGIIVQCDRNWTKAYEFYVEYETSYIDDISSFVTFDKKIGICEESILEAGTDYNIRVTYEWGIITTEAEQLVTVEVVDGVARAAIKSGKKPEFGMIVVLGKSGDCIIGVNSNDGSTGYLRPRGISMSTLDKVYTAEVTLYKSTTTNKIVDYPVDRIISISSEEKDFQTEEISVDIQVDRTSLLIRHERYENQHKIKINYTALPYKVINFYVNTTKYTFPIDDSYTRIIGEKVTEEYSVGFDKAGANINKVRIITEGKDRLVDFSQCIFERVSDNISFRGTIQSQKIELQYQPATIDNIVFSRPSGATQPSDAALAGIEVKQIESDGILVTCATDWSGEYNIVVSYDSTWHSETYVKANIFFETPAIDFHKSSLPNLFIGDFDSEDGFWQNQNINAEGYGLYCDNVIVKGSLTTLDNGLMQYAGINSSSNVYPLVGEGQPFAGTDLTEEEAKTDAIILWGGANGISDSAIQFAKFQVTKKGYLYADSAKFEHSIFANSSIHGSDIYTARIHGTGDDINKPALSIFNTADKLGISFYANEDETDISKCTLNITSTGLQTYYSNALYNFISLNNNGIYYNGTSFSGTSGHFDALYSNLSDKKGPKTISGETYDGNFIKIKNNYIRGFADNYSANSYIKFTNDETYGIISIGSKRSVSAGDNDLIIIANDQLNVNIKDSYFNGKLNMLSTLGNGKNLYYTPVTGGYDLYVTIQETGTDD